MAALSNAQKQIQRVKGKNEGAKEYVPNKQTRYISKTGIYETEIIDLPNTEFKIMVVKMLTMVREQCMNKMRISVKRQKISKIQNRIYRAQNYNNWTEKLNKGIQQQTRSSERKEQ